MPPTTIASDYTGGPDPDCRVVAPVRLPLMERLACRRDAAEDDAALLLVVGLLVEAAPGCERPRRPVIEASVFVTTALLLATSNRSTWKIPSRLDSRRGARAGHRHPRARRAQGRLPAGSNVAPPRPHFGSSPAGGAPRGSVRPGANGLSGHSAQYSDAPPPMTCASCAASVGSSGRRRSSIRSASGRWPMSTYVSPRYSMACGKLGRRRSASW